MQKVAIITNNSWAAYNFRFNLAKALKESGYKVVFIAPYDEKYSELLKKEFNFFGVYIDANGVNPISDIRTIFDLYTLFRSIKPQVVLNFTIKPNIYSSMVARIFGIKSISNITGLGTIFIKRSITTKIVKFLYKFSLGFNKKVFFQNSDDKDLFVSNGLIKEDKVDLLPGSGIDIDRFKPINARKSDKTIFLLISRLLGDKGIFEYVEAIKIIKKRYASVKFQILGSVDVKNTTAISKRELQTWVDDGLIEYLGTTDDVRDAISKVDCVVLPSYREGTPRSLLEAAAMEKPIITTNVAGCKEVVDDGINGYLCRVKDAKDLAIKIEKFINLSIDTKVAMGTAGREKIIKKFDEKIVINKYLHTIKDCP